MRPRVLGAFLSALVSATAVQASPLSFEQALRAAQYEQPALEAGRLQVEARRQAAPAAGQLPDPRLRAGIANLPLTGDRALDPTQMTQIQVGIEQEIPNLAQRRARRAEADADVELAQAQLGETERQILVRTARAWIDLAYAESALREAEAALSRVDDLLPLADASVAAGSARPAASLDLQRALLEIEDARTELEAEREVAQAKITRFVAVAEPTATGDVPSPYVSPAELRGTLARNPQVLVADSISRRRQASVELAEADKRPDFGVSASYGVRDRTYGDLVSLMGTITLPFFAERRQEPVIRAARADAAAALAARDDLLRNLEAQFEADVAEWRSELRQWERARDELLPLARQRVRLERASFAGGRAELIDVIGAIKTVALLEIEVLEREAAAVQAAVTLRLTYSEDVQ